MAIKKAPRGHCIGAFSILLRHGIRLYTVFLYQELRNLDRVERRPFSDIV